MIKKINWIPLLFLIPALLFIVGCPDEGPEEVIPTPSGLTIIANDTGLGVILTWNQEIDVDGYDVVTPDGSTIELEYDENSYTDANPGQTGTYTVYCVINEERGDAAEISSAPYVSTTNITVYGWLETGDSGFGWTVATGICQSYSCAGAAGNEDVIDFFFYDQASYFHFISGDETPYNGNKTSHILRMGESDFDIAPTTGYFNMEDVIAGNYYAINVHADYYGKIKVVSSTGSSATFSYEFQKIRDLRIF